jgi:hypothetical protein
MYNVPSLVILGCVENNSASAIKGNGRKVMTPPAANQSAASVGKWQTPRSPGYRYHPEAFRGSGETKRYGWVDVISPPTGRFDHVQDHTNAMASKDLNGALFVPHFVNGGHPGHGSL